MAIGNTVTEFAGLPVVNYNPAVGIYQKPVEPGSLLGALTEALRSNPKDKVSRLALSDYLMEQGEQLPAVAYRVGGEGDTKQLKAFLADPFVGLVQGLVLGFCWPGNESGSKPVVKLLRESRERLANLRALFVGDITYEECEISWLNQSDLTGLFAAFPQLEHFRARGGEALGLSPFEHKNLKSLAFEASNLPSAVVRAVEKCQLPALEHLELWLGTSEYGADTTVADLSGILGGELFPALRYLGIRNSEIADDVAVAVAQSALLKRIRVLDLSLGTLGDRGAEALLASPAVAKLEKLDIHRHYVSPELVERLENLGIEVDASDEQEVEDPDEPDEDRYVAHAE